jgi:ABC-type spermidine/putrescine transport system permease subunit II
MTRLGHCPIQPNIIFAFTISFSDINLALFIGGPNSTTLPVLFEGQSICGSDPTMQILIVGQLIWLVQYLTERASLVELLTASVSGFACMSIPHA